jgi:hypothetical protein
MRCSNIFRLRACGGSVAWLLVAATLYAQPAGTAAVRMDAGRVENRISPTLYGHFVEFMFEGIKFGLHAELLRNRGFEEPANAVGLPRHWDREPDDRNDSDIHFRWDDSVSYPIGRGPAPERVEHSLGVDLRADAGELRGLSQARLPIRQGVEYRGSIWIKNQTFEGQMRVVLEQDRSDGQSYAMKELPVVADASWRRYAFALAPSRSDPLAKLAILFNGHGRLWLDQASLMPGDAVDGIRRDVLEKVRALRPAFIRWPGGNVAQDYHWGWGIGPRDERPIWTNLSWANELEPSDLGTDEYVRLCRNVGAEPTIELIAVGDNDMDWNRTVLKLAGPHSDYLSIHHYYGLREMQGDTLNLMARPLYYERFYQQVAAVLRELVSGREIKLAINEWNTSLPVPRQHSMEAALYAARMMNVFERSGELVQMTAVSDLVNGWSGGVIQASRYAVFVTPTYLAVKLYNVLRGREFEDGDLHDRPFVAIISESLARQSFGADDPIGHRIKCGFDSDQWMTIVGVVGDVRQASPASPPGPELYMPLRQHPYAATNVQMVIRTSVDPESVGSRVPPLVRAEAPSRGGVGAWFSFVFPTYYSASGPSLTRRGALPGGLPSADAR